MVARGGVEPTTFRTDNIHLTNHAHTFRSNFLNNNLVFGTVGIDALCLKCSSCGGTNSAISAIDGCLPLHYDKQEDNTSLHHRILV